MEKKEKPEENFNVGLKMEVGDGLIPESKDTGEKMEIDIVSMEGKDFLINALQKKLMGERDWALKNEQQYYFMSRNLSRFLSELEKDIGVAKNELTKPTIKEFILIEMHKFLPYEYTFS